IGRADDGGVNFGIGFGHDRRTQIAAKRAFLQIRETVFGAQGYVIRQPLLKSAADRHAIERRVVDAKLLPSRADTYIVDFSAGKSDEPVGQHVVSKQVTGADARGPAVVEAHEVPRGLT